MAQYIITNEPEDVNFEIGDDIIARTIQNCKNLLMTRMGEVPYDRYRGFDPAFYELPLPELQEKLLPELNRLTAAGVHVYLMHLDDEDALAEKIKGTGAVFAPLFGA